MSFDLAVLAPAPDMDAAAVRRMFGQCAAAVDHQEGEPDSRITAFYEQLRSVYPDHGPDSETPASPWSSAPLDVGIDHVIMQLSHRPVSTPAVDVILKLASRHRLAVYDPQSDDAYLP